jgi:hypothetical protein
MKALFISGIVSFFAVFLFACSDFKQSKERHTISAADKQPSMPLPRLPAIGEYVDLSEEENMKLYFPDPSQKPDYRHLESAGNLLDGLKKNGWFEVTDNQEKCSTDRALESGEVTFPRVDGVSCFQKDSLNPYLS